MIRVLILCLLNVAFVARADVMSEPWPRKVRDFPTDLPSNLIQGRFRITISDPIEAKRRELGGSGGPMLEFNIRNWKLRLSITFYDQSIATVLLESFHGYPQLEVWGSGGGGSWSRELIRFVRGKYRSVRIDEFTEDKALAKKKSVTVVHPLSGETLYFVETRSGDIYLTDDGQ